ncbi:MAG: hypothetical protein EAZ09_12255 [Oscillatoriales cyanobacterium]|nr:MAG: hypothetical protein EAZ18_10710 [Oscillatoriales cyanobacterium]TAH21494.1 MAG: hypothetical protein EAZ09_12255 [Oscillatoriales cyanobacterium]
MILNKQTTVNLLQGFDMADSLFYDKGGVRITRTIFEVPGTQYQIRNINSVTLFTGTPDRRGPIICIVIGVFTLIAVFGILLIALGIWWWNSQKPTYIIRMNTSARDVDGYESPNLQEIKEIHAALNAAMAQLA